MVTTTLQGRTGNIFYQIAMLLAYAKKHNLEYYIPNRAYHCDGNKMYFDHMAMGPEIHGLQEYHEQTTHALPKGDGTYHYNVPGYHDISAMDNTRFVGYWQTFEYIDWCRDYILEKFQLPYNKRIGVVSIHVRRGDFLQLTDKHPPIPMEYYYKAIQMFREQGRYSFTVFSDDIQWCKEQFIGDDIIFSEGLIELEDMIAMSECEHNICCYSTFSFIAAWLNQNTDKIVCIPEEKYIFGGANKDMIPSYYKQIEI